MNVLQSVRSRPPWPKALVAGNLLGILGVIGVAGGFGMAAAFFLVVLVGAIVGGLTHARALAIVILVVAPLPSVEQILGVSSRAGLDVVDILVFLGVGMAIMRALQLPLIDERFVILMATANFGLLLLAWYRGYGGEGGSLSSLTLVLHPAVIFVAGLLIVQLLEPDKAVESVALGCTAMLGIVGLSVLAQAVHIYSPPVLDPAVKANGGIMLQGNEAAALFSTFAVPIFVLLRSIGRGRLGAALLLYSLPVVLVTASRTSLLILPLALLALAVFDRRAQTARVVAGVAVVAALYVGTVGRTDTQNIVRSFTQHSVKSNESLSGRPYLWNKAVLYLDQDSHWLIGGGLNGFEQYTALDLKLSHHGYTTHNVWLRQLVNGGILMAIGYFGFLLALWRLSRRSNTPSSIALRVAVLCTIFLGLTKDLNPFDRGGVWLWVFAALAASPAAALARERSRKPKALKAEFSAPALR